MVVPACTATVLKTRTSAQKVTLVRYFGAVGRREAATLHISLRVVNKAGVRLCVQGVTKRHILHRHTPKSVQNLYSLGGFAHISVLLAAVSCLPPCSRRGDNLCRLHSCQPYN